MDATLRPEDPDATERRTLEARVHQLEQQLQALTAKHEQVLKSHGQLEGIIDLAPLTIYMKDASNSYVLVNRAYERLSGAPRSAILGRTDFEIFPEPVALLFRSQDEEVEARNEPVDFRETIPLPDGVHSFITSKFPLRLESGAFGGVVGLCTEVTALEQANAQLAQANAQLEQAQAELLKRERLALLGELAAVVAHEVRNPLGVIFNAISVLKRSEASRPQSLGLLGLIDAEAERLNRMVGALLDLGRPMQATLRPTAAAAVVTAAIEEATTLADQTAEVHVRVSGALPLVSIDERLVRQALVNLVCNAIQAPHRRGPVVVTIAAEPGALRFEVSDDGDGVPAQLTEKIFAPFFTTRAAGTGLGLTLVRRVAEAHHGTVAMTQTPGQGATFVLRLLLPEA